MKTFRLFDFLILFRASPASNFTAGRELSMEAQNIGQRTYELDTGLSIRTISFPQKLEGRSELGITSATQSPRAPNSPK